MPTYSSLPHGLKRAGFRVADATALGVSMSRLRSHDLEAPFHGTRMQRADAPSAISATRARALALYAVLPQGAYFSHVTAAQLYGAPLPLHVDGEPMHVSAPPARRALRRNGVVWHQSQLQPPLRVQDRLLAAAPGTVWCQLAGSLSLEDLVAVGDYFVTGEQPIRADQQPLTSIAELTLAVEAHGSRRGAQLLREALALVRYGPLSRPESLTRLALVQAGLPEPALNFVATHPTRRRRYVLDLAYPELKLGLDYEGDYHRTDRAQFRSDIRRVEELAELGWRDMRVTADDVNSYRREFIERVRFHRTNAQSLLALGPAPAPGPA